MAVLQMVPVAAHVVRHQVVYMAPQPVQAVRPLHHAICRLEHLFLIQQVQEHIPATVITKIKNNPRGMRGFLYTILRRILAYIAYPINNAIISTNIIQPIRASSANGNFTFMP